MALPGPALKQGAVDDQPGGGVQVLHDWHLVTEGVGDQGRVGADDAGDGGLRDAVELGEQPLGKVVPQPGSGSGARTGTPPFQACWPPGAWSPSGSEGRRSRSRRVSPTPSAGARGTPPPTAPAPHLRTRNLSARRP